MGTKIEIEISEENMRRIKLLREREEKLRERYDKERGDLNGQALQDLIAAINSLNTDINQILLNSVYDNKDWQQK